MKRILLQRNMYLTCDVISEVDQNLLNVTVVHDCIKKTTGETSEPTISTAEVTYRPFSDRAVSQTLSVRPTTAGMLNDHNRTTHISSERSQPLNNVTEMTTIKIISDLYQTTVVSERAETTSHVNEETFEMNNDNTSKIIPTSNVVTTTEPSNIITVLDNVALIGSLSALASTFFLLSLIPLVKILYKWRCFVTRLRIHNSVTNQSIELGLFEHEEAV